MAKYTLDETWELCLQLWKWIAERIKDNPSSDVVGLNVVALKREWMRERGLCGIRADCFFCDYSVEIDPEFVCGSCPGKLIDPEFDCDDPEYDYFDYPIKFYEKLLELDKKRKE